MNDTSQPVRARFHWRWLIDSPLVLATWASVAMCLVAIVQVAHALRDADRLRVRSTRVLAEVAAEAAVARLVEQPPVELPVTMAVGRVPVTVASHGDGWLVTAGASGGEQREYLCTLLPGASPAALGRPLTVVDPLVAEELPGATVGPLPSLAKDVMAQAWRAETLAAFRREVGIALMNFSAGTDLDDFVIDPKVRGLGLGPDTGCVVVPGHLWIEPGPTCWRVTLDRDLTIVVCGNLYVGRSIIVDGIGRLTFAVQGAPNAHGFADLDGNGRWSAGDRASDGGALTGVAEGGGNVYLGLRSSGGFLSQHVEAGLIVAGELHLRGTCRVDGPVALAHGLVRLGDPGATLEPVGERLFVPEREVAPGFCLTGGSRPGLLRPRRPNRGTAEVPLYLASPAR
jgi:hypothetical protein